MGHFGWWSHQCKGLILRLADLIMDKRLKKFALLRFESASAHVRWNFLMALTTYPFTKRTTFISSKLKVKKCILKSFKSNFRKCQGHNFPFHNLFHILEAFFKNDFYFTNSILLFLLQLPVAMVKTLSEKWLKVHKWASGWEPNQMKNKL